METASNGFEAFEMIKNGYENQPNPILYDLVILDLNMPIMDGFEACQMIFKTFDKQVMFEESKSYMI